MVTFIVFIRTGTFVLRKEGNKLLMNVFTEYQLHLLLASAIFSNSISHDHL